MSNLIETDPSGEPVTTSLLVAEKFHKHHKNVIRKIESLDKDVISRLNFEPRDYIDDRGKSQKMYILNRDAFSFIAMGFTGKNADQWKLDYIAAFNKMESTIKRQLKRQAKTDWKALRRTVAVENKLMCSTLKDLRGIHGKNTKDVHYMNENKLVNFVMTGKYQGINRNQLNDEELKTLTALEIRNTLLIGMGIGRNERRERLIKFHQEISAVMLEDKEVNHV